MIPSSMRRIVAAAPQSPLLASFTPAGARASAAAAISFPRGLQRRRYSSSKPSSPNDSSRIAAGQMTASSTQSGESSKSSKSSKASGEKKAKKVKDSSSGLPKLPSVPSTDTVPRESLALACFFALHRPMSVHQGFPTTVTDDAFAQIFSSRNKKGPFDEVVSTLSRAVDDLEQPMHNLSINKNQQSVSNDSHDHQLRVEMKSLDGSESSMYIQLNSMSGQFFPFRPPPLPQAEPSTSAAEVGAGEMAEAEPQHRIYKAIVTLEETTDSNGDVRIYAHSPRLVEEDTSSQTFVRRMPWRQIRQEEVRGRPHDMVAISVRRQRKLKMKKKKYKKLMKRTRTERRKLDRI